MLDLLPSGLVISLSEPVGLLLWSTLQPSSEPSPELYRARKEEKLILTRDMNRNSGYEAAVHESCQDNGKYGINLYK